MQQPVNVVLGTRQKPSKSGNSREMREVADSMVYIPVLETLQLLLENENVIAEV